MANILKNLKENELKQFIIKNLKKDEILFHEGERCEYVTVVENGEIEIISYSYSGKEILFSRLTDNMMFGNNLVFSSDPYFKGNVIARKKSKVYLIKKEQILNIFQQNTAFLMDFLKYQSDIGKELNGHIRLLNLPGAEERFLYYLHSKNGIIQFETITKLAASINLQRETLSRLIYKLIKEGKISKTRHIIKIIN